MGAGVIAPLLQAGGGLIQSIVGGIGAGRRQRQLNAQIAKMPKYTQNQSILDYYNKALARYNVSPTDTAMYKSQMKDIDRSAATGLGYLQDRRSGLAGASSIVRNVNDAKLKANVAAEDEQAKRFGVLGGATQMKSGEDRAAWEQNVWRPYELKTNLLMQRAGAANQMTNTGIQNLFGGLQNWGQYQMMKDFYKDDKKG